MLSKNEIYSLRSTSTPTYFLSKNILGVLEYKQIWNNNTPIELRTKTAWSPNR